MEDYYGCDCTGCDCEVLGPTSVPTVTSDPSIPPTFAPSCVGRYTLYMYDTYGDGWNSNYWTWSDGTTTSSGTLSSGPSGTTQLCGDCSYTILVDSSGSYTSEVSGTLQDSDGATSASGAADDTAYDACHTPVPLSARLLFAAALCSITLPAAAPVTARAVAISGTRA